MIGSTVISTIGFGFGIVTTPLLLFFLEPQTVVILVNIVSLVAYSIVVFQSRNSVRLKEIVPISLAGMAGVPLGIFLLGFLNASLLRSGISILVLTLVVLVAFDIRPSLPKPKILSVLFGFVVGALLSLTGIGGALMVIFLLTRGWNKAEIRGSMPLFFLIIGVCYLIGYGFAGFLTQERLLTSSLMVVPVIIGVIAGTILSKRINDQKYRRGVCAVLIATSFVVLVREIPNF